MKTPTKSRILSEKTYIIQSAWECFAEDILQVIFLCTINSVLTFGYIYLGRNTSKQDIVGKGKVEVCQTCDADNNDLMWGRVLSYASLFIRVFSQSHI